MDKKEQVFVKAVWGFYKENGRHDLPWRKKSHLKPYNILVSEMMLQQTQVARVVPKYKEFLKQWGSARALASAPLRDVLTAWQGLGYNRRAKYLHDAVKGVMATGGKFPKTADELKKLPGIGEYTAGAIMAFAYNQPAVMIETNIRTVYLHHFFNGKTNVSDKEILSLVEKTCDQENPREWYWALMDYGSYLKQAVGNNIVASKHYKKQSRFKGSDREVRGAIVRGLSGGSVTAKELTTQLNFEAKKIAEQLSKLEAENMVVKKGKWYTLPR